MKIYIAARFPKRAEMEIIADKLKSYGHEITSSWVYGGEEGLTRENIAVLDINDVARADLVLSFTEPYGTFVPGGGRHVEFGCGLALGKSMVIIGDRENVFHHYPNVAVYSTLEDWLH